jgi:hypothetical protein
VRRAVERKRRAAVEKDETTAGGGWQGKVVLFRLFSGGRALEGTTLPFKFLEFLRQYHFSFFFFCGILPFLILSFSPTFTFSFWHSV